MVAKWSKRKEDKNSSRQPSSRKGAKWNKKKEDENSSRQLSGRKVTKGRKKEYRGYRK